MRARAAVSYREIIALAWPASIAAAVTPLLGAIDVWALGQSSRPLDIAAVGLGSVIFSLAYWTFGFIRMSVAGLAAQASGAGDEAEARTALMRGALLGAGIGLALVVLQLPVRWIAFAGLSFESEASAATFASARAYFDARIWGAPFALASYAAFGWLSARGRTDYLMIVSLLITGLNIGLDIWFALILGWGSAGVAAGTAIAECVGFLASAFFVLRVMAQNGGLATDWSLARLLKPDALARTASVNRDIFLRTILLALSFSWFVQRGGAFGDVTLAANQTLLQLFLFTGLALDGTAIAAETLVGRAIGDPDPVRGLARYRAAVRRTFIVSGIAAFACVALYAVFGAAILGVLTGDGAIRAMAGKYLVWTILSPLAVVVGFQLDGIFIGATRAREMRNSMFLSAPAFFALSIVLAGAFGNHGLWAAFLAYFVLRGATMGAVMGRITRGFEARIAGR